MKNAGKRVRCSGCSSEFSYNRNTVYCNGQPKTAGAFWAVCPVCKYKRYLSGVCSQISTWLEQAEEDYVTPDEKLTAFLYELIRDHVTPGIVEGLVQNDYAFPGPYEYSNVHLANYAKELAARILMPREREAQRKLKYTEDESTAVAKEGCPICSGTGKYYIPSDGYENSKSGYCQSCGGHGDLINFAKYSLNQLRRDYKRNIEKLESLQEEVPRMSALIVLCESLVSDEELVVG